MLKVHAQVVGLETTNETSPVLAVEARGLTKRFGRRTVVRDLSFSIPKGTVFGLIGPNGAGKSTTLKMLMNMLRLSGGSASVLGKDVATEFQSVKHRIGYVPENHHIYRWMRVHRVIRMVRSFYPSWCDERCEQMLELLELEPGKRVRELSKGMLAKLALLLAVSHKPEVLILDEPMSGLDPIVREEFVDGVLQVICDHETTVIFSSHTIDDIQRLADTVGILNEGELLVNEPVESLLASCKRIRATIDDDFQPRWIPESTVSQNKVGRRWNLTVSQFQPDLYEQLTRQNSLIHVEVQDMNLEEVFKDFINGKRRLQNDRRASLKVTRQDGVTK